MKMLLLVSSLVVFNFANAQTATGPSQLAKSVEGQCDQAKVALATVQEALVHLSMRNTDSVTEAKIASAESALYDTMYLTSELSKGLCP